MAFTREEFYGLDFDWYGVDADGSVAKFTTGHASIPKNIFSSEILYERIQNYFTSLPEITKSHLSPKFLNSKFAAQGDFSYAIKDTKKGLYVFDCFDYTEDYYLVSIPERNITVSELPSDIQQALEQCTLRSVKFADIYIIRVMESLDCD